jgi:hypothetical protein
MRTGLGALLIMIVSACGNANESTLRPAVASCAPFDASTGAACPARGTTCQDYGGSQDGTICDCTDGGWLCGAHQ